MFIEIFDETFGGWCGSLSRHLNLLRNLRLAMSIARRILFSLEAATRGRDDRRSLSRVSLRGSSSRDHRTRVDRAARPVEGVVAHGGANRAVDVGVGVRANSLEIEGDDVPRDEEGAGNRENRRECR